MFFLKSIKKIIIIILIFLTFDVIFFSLLPEDLKSKLYNNRAHRIKSFYYHHDFRPNASFYDVWGYERYKIFTNNLGFKDKSNRKISFKNRNILFIGDSFTEGVGIKYDETFVGIIEKKLKKKYDDIEILNAGVQSYSTSIYLSKIYHLVERKKLPITDIVIMVSGGDIFDDYFKYLDLNEEFILNHVDKKNKYLINIINFIKSNTLTYQLITLITPPKVIPERIKSIFSKEKIEKNYKEKEKKLLLIKNEEIDKMKFLTNRDYAYFYSIEEFNNWGKKAIDKSIGNLEEISKITKKNKINLNILYLIEPILILKQPDKKQYDYLINGLKNLEKQNVKVNILGNMYNNYKDEYDTYKNLFFINDIHFNKKGNLEVAKEIMTKVDF